MSNIFLEKNISCPPYLSHHFQEISFFGLHTDSTKPDQPLTKSWSTLCGWSSRGGGNFVTEVVVLLWAGLLFWVLWVRIVMDLVSWFCWIFLHWFGFCEYCCRVIWVRNENCCVFLCWELLGEKWELLCYAVLRIVAV